MYECNERKMISCILDEQCLTISGSMDTIIIRIKSSLQNPYSYGLTNIIVLFVHNVWFTLIYLQTEN